MRLLHAKNISLGYFQKNGSFKYVVQDFNVVLNTGEIVTLLGTSGIGKSSILQVLAGLVSAQSGEIFVFDQQINKPHPKVAFIFQTPVLLSWLNVYENVAFGLSFKNQPKITKKEARFKLHEILIEVDLIHAKELYPHELSGGMAQRVALARALVRNPSIILLDEPFSALDEITRQKLINLLKKFINLHNAAAILVTHDIDEALLISNRILLVGSTPAKIIRQWNINKNFKTETALLHLQKERIEILENLQYTKQGNILFETD